MSQEILDRITTAIRNKDLLFKVITDHHGVTLPVFPAKVIHPDFSRKKHLRRQGKDSTALILHHPKKDFPCRPTKEPKKP